jgi:hypothetical protein
MRSKLALAAGLLSLLVPAAAYARGPRTLVVREGLTVAQLDLDGKICLKEAKAAEKGHPIAPVAGGGGPARLAGAAMAGALKGLSDIERFNAAHDACLERLGYRQVELTAEERKAFDRLKKNEERLSFVVEFSRRAIAERR